MNQKREVSQCLAKYYSEMLDEFGTTSMGVGWGNIEERARSRYMEMIRIIREFKDKRSKLRVVDVGCGYESLLETIKKRYIDITYTGIDVVDSTIASGKRKYPRQASYLLCFEPRRNC